MRRPPVAAEHSREVHGERMKLKERKDQPGANKGEGGGGRGGGGGGSAGASL